VPSNPLVDQPPAETAALLAGLESDLDAAGLPARDSAHLLIGTWNIRDFAGLTGAWNPSATDSPKRNLADVCCIAAILSRFDVCAVQETRSELTAMLTIAAPARPGLGRDPHRRRPRRRR
jgi:hypothetical protein